MAVESKRQPQGRGGGGSRSGRGGAAAKEKATTKSEAGGEGSSAAQGGAALATLVTPSSPSTSAGRAPPSQRTLRKQSRASLQSPYPPRGSPRTPRRAGLLSSTSFTGSPQAPNSPRSPSMRALSAIVSLISPFSSARKSAAFGHPDETLNEDDEETRMDEDVEDDEEEDDVASQLYPSLPSEAKRIEYVAEDDSEQQESVEDEEAESSSKSQAEEEDEDGTEVLSGLDDDDIAVTEDGYGVLDVTIVESEADQTRPVNGHANAITPALTFGSKSAQQSVPVASPSLPPARSPFRASAFPAPLFSTPSKMGFGAVAAAPVASAFDGPSVPIASTPFTFGAAGASQAVGLPTYPRPSATAKNTSPLSKNYDQLARFFAQKAAQEARAEASTSMRSMDEDEDGNEATGGGLTEIEMAGCMRLIEQSYAHGQGAEIDRLRQEALDGERMYDDSRQQLLDDEEAAFARGRHANRSPSLPLGAAAGEAPVAEQYAGFRSRPSSSFLAPTAYQRSEDARINRSLATAFQSAPASAAPPARRHRPLYLGPGVSASATAAILRRNQQAQARRGALNSHRAAQQARLQDASRRAEEQRGVESPIKRRKLPGDQDDQPALFTTPTPQPLPATPSAMQTQPQGTSTRPAKRPAPEAAPPPPAARSATADAMLSILSSGPAIPSRAPVAPPTVSNPDVVNPYETTSRLTRRTMGASSVAAKEKERLREEREKRLKAMKEKEAREANETLRRAARAQIGGKKRGMRVEEEDEEDDVAEDKAQQDRNKKAEEDRRRKNEELKRRTEKLMSKSKAAADTPESTTKQSAATTKTSDQSVAAKPSEKKAEQIPVPKPFSFNSAFAPKKPSPLSQAANSAGPDSPSGSSEASERTMKSSTSPGKFAFNTPASTAAPIVLDDDDEDDDESQIVATVKSAPPLPAFSFGANAAANATTKPSSPLPASSAFGASPASASNTSTSAQKPLFALTPAAAPKPSTTQSPSEQASKADVSSLPKFDFALDVVVANASTHIGLGDAIDKEAREAALSTSTSSLPKFDFAASGQTPFSATTGQMPSSVTTGQTPSPATPSHDASADATDGNTTSALLSGTGEGEEDEESIHQVRCKVWSLSDGKWKDMGIGILRVKKNTQTSKQRVLVRSEGNGRVMVNFSVYASLKPTQDKTVVSFLGFDETGKPLSYRCKSKTEDSARQLKEALEASAAAMAAA